jgi:hypothetical protein
MATPQDYTFMPWAPRSTAPPNDSDADTADGEYLLPHALHKIDDFTADPAATRLLAN